MNIILKTLRKIFKNDFECSSEYWIDYYGKKFKDIRKEDKTLSRVVVVEGNNFDDIGYMLNCTLIDSGVKVYKVYSNGKVRRLKLGIPRRLPYKKLEKIKEKENEK